MFIDVLGGSRFSLLDGIFLTVGACTEAGGTTTGGTAAARVDVEKKEVMVCMPAFRPFSFLFFFAFASHAFEEICRCLKFSTPPLPMRI